jgi:hypothetical protein
VAARARCAATAVQAIAIKNRRYQPTFGLTNVEQNRKIVMRRRGWTRSVCSLTPIFSGGVQAGVAVVVAADRLEDSKVAAVADVADTDVNLELSRCCWSTASSTGG